MLPKPLVLSTLISLMFAGCATQESLTEQTRPMHDRLDRLEQTLKASNAAGQARHDALDKDIDGLKSALKVLVAKLGDQGDRSNRLTTRMDESAARQEALADRSSRTESRLDKLASATQASLDQAADNRQKLTERVAQAEMRLDENATTSRESGEEAVEERQKLAERVAQAEMRLDELATAANEQSPDGSAEELAKLAERATQAEMRLDEIATVTKASVEQSDEERRQLAERLAQAETRLNEFGAAVPKWIARTDQRLDALSGTVNEALALATQENIRLHGKEAFSVMLTEDKTLYPINSPELGSLDIAKLDDLVDRLAKLEQDYHLDIQGHTDNIGTEDYNYELGKARATVVKRYLSDKKGISLSRMSVISFGAGSPVDRAGNQNRRIAIRVLVLK